MGTAVSAEDIVTAPSRGESQQRPATYQESAPIEMHQQFARGNSPLKAMSEQGHFEEIQMPKQVQRPTANRVPLGQAQDMPPPPRPMQMGATGKYLLHFYANSLTSTAHIATPQHRTALPSSARPTANRSHLPVSTTRIESRNQFDVPRGSQTLLRHQVSAGGPIHRASASTSRGFGGISGGMKVGSGRAGTAVDAMGSARYGQHDCKCTGKPT